MAKSALAWKDEDSDEWFYSSKDYILSETDDKGIILYANETFCEVAGYTLDELIGQPHNIVRHPDMPRIAFKGLWEDIRSKGFWVGHVKNLRKDGGYYWVLATVIRKLDSNGNATFLSVRVKPNLENVKKYEKLYKELRRNE